MFPMDESMVPFCLSLEEWRSLCKQIRALDVLVHSMGHLVHLIEKIEKQIEGEEAFTRMKKFQKPWIMKGDD